MKIVIFGLTISSSWGNGHATLWRGLSRALIQGGHEIIFYERDVPYYAEMRDLHEIPGGRLELYQDWQSIRRQASADASDADVAIISSYCPDSLAAGDVVLADCRGLRVFYDLDTPITLARLEAGESVPYIAPSGLSGFDLVLSYSGGRALDEFHRRLGARRVAPLYGHVDPDLHCPARPLAHYRADLSYLGTYSEDRQEALEALLVAPAQKQPDRKFLIGGAQYPQHFPWSSNIYFVRHLPPAEHAAFFCSSRLTLNVTRRAMVESGWCPSGRLFEAAACGAPIVSDVWEGLDAFFQPDEEIILAEGSGDVMAALELGDQELQTMARRARERTLQEHSSRRRADELIHLLESASHRQPGVLASVGV
ncbi:MAG TPA: glycosyltransferase [Bradyrhizobium sp.]|jgi:spore maturation protein CgeB|uniref:CgeB family protein n=1 Tax=Bradyrhizobium sp. TaxID=376 RepID=UPI002B4A6C2E|nr:glycosyltransferase [Bradyrhizobium sp.]HKO72369.1 glycosyltransferase [Bradyrhizobium sp.]